jgi:hypothetical protein
LFRLTSTLMEENEKLRKDFEETHKKNETIKQRNKELVERRELSEKKIKSLSAELVTLSKSVGPASRGRQDFQRGLTEILKLIDKRCTDSDLVDECYDLGYSVQADVNELQSHTTAEYEVHLQESPSHVKRRLELEGYITTPTSGSSIKSKRKKKLNGSLSNLKLNGSLTSLKMNGSFSSLKNNGSFSSIGSPEGLAKKGKRKQTLKTPISPDR